MLYFTKTKVNWKRLIWIMTKQQKTKRLSSPQGLGAPPVNPEGEDSLTNWPRFMLHFIKTKVNWKILIWIMTKQQKTKRLSSPQGLGAPPVNPEGEHSLTNWPRINASLYENKSQLENTNFGYWLNNKKHRLSSPQGLGAPPVNPEGEDSLTNWPTINASLYENKSQLENTNFGYWLNNKKQKDSRHPRVWARRL